MERAITAGQVLEKDINIYHYCSGRNINDEDGNNNSVCDASQDSVLSDTTLSDHQPGLQNIFIHKKHKDHLS